MYSDISIRIRLFSSLNRSKAKVLANSVFPTPVGPKNINDPIANPTYFFRKPGDEAAIKLVSLNNLNEKLKEDARVARIRFFYIFDFSIFIF